MIIYQLIKCLWWEVSLTFKWTPNINSKVLTFAFSLSAEIERNLISQRTKEALARKKSEGMRLGRPIGSQNKEVKLTGKEEDIKKLLDKQVSVSAIARILDVNRLTVRSFIKTRKLEVQNSWFYPL